MVSSSDEAQSAQAMKELGLFILMAPLFILLPLLLLDGAIQVQVFEAVGALWFLIALLLIVNPGRLAEVSIGWAKVNLYAESAEKDAKAAREAKEEAEAIRDDLRKLARLNIENTFLLNSLVSGCYDPNRTGYQLPPAINRIEANLQELTPLVSNDPKLVELWQAEVRDLVRQEPETVLKLDHSFE